MLWISEQLLIINLSHCTAMYMYTVCIACTGLHSSVFSSAKLSGDFAACIKIAEHVNRRIRSHGELLKSSSNNCNLR